MQAETTTLTQQTVDRLRELIVGSGLKPGEPLAREADLETRLGVSRPILREAISRLRALGMLDSRQSVGLIVGNPDPVGLFEQAFGGWVSTEVDLRELAEVRYSLEIGAVELACRRATAEQIARLGELADEFKRIYADPAGLRPMDDVELEFHGTLLEASHNTMLIRMHGVLSAFFARSAVEIDGWDIYGSDERSVWEHQAIARALGERNVERVRALLSGHLGQLITLFYDKF